MYGPISPSLLFAEAEAAGNLRSVLQTKEPATNEIYIIMKDDLLDRIHLMALIEGISFHAYINNLLEKHIPIK